VPEIRVSIDVERWPTQAIQKLHDEGRTGDIIYSTEPLEIGALPGGMQSGRTSIAVFFTLPDGRVVIADTSLRALRTVVETLAAAYPLG
jgi:hypothetical protein